MWYVGINSYKKSELSFLLTLADTACSSGKTVSVIHITIYWQNNLVCLVILLNKCFLKTLDDTKKHVTPQSLACHLVTNVACMW